SMLFVRTLVAGKTGIAIDAEHRAAIGARIGDELLAHPRKPRRHRRNELRHRPLNRFLEAVFVGFKPGPLVVRSQLAKEGEQVGRKALEAVTRHSVSLLALRRDAGLAFFLIFRT